MVLMSIELNVLPTITLFGNYASRSSWRHFSRIADEYILYIVESGEMYIKEKGIEYILKRGDMLLLEPGKLHAGFKDSICKYFFIHFLHPQISRADENTVEDITLEMDKNRQSSLECCEGNSVSSFSPCYFPKFYHSNNQIELFDMLESECSDFLNRFENYAILASWKVAELLLKISREYASFCIDGSYRNYSKTQARVSSIVNYLNSEYCNKITSTEIEKVFEGNFDYLNRIFHTISGQTIFKYLNHIRINNAKRLIETSELKTAEIGYLVGIDDPYYFSKQFKKYTGITPTEYLKEKRKSK